MNKRPFSRILADAWELTVLIFLVFGSIAALVFFEYGVAWLIVHADLPTGWSAILWSIFIAANCWLANFWIEGADY